MEDFERWETLDNRKLDEERGRRRSCPSNPWVSGLRPAAVQGEHLSARTQEGEDSSCIQGPFGQFSREDCVGLGMAPALGHVLA
jgi:hypothetical protein